MTRLSRVIPIAAALFGVLAVGATAQSLTLPPDGGNQKGAVSQWIGLVEVNITYNSPKVTAPDGTDRTGKIWGQLVPYGMSKQAVGTCGDQCPWRAGANENTVFRVSHDVKIEGQPLAAGSYGLHMIPDQEEWTVIFSKNDRAWGSFFYNPAEDALRVKVKPTKCEYNHWLTYEFSERRLDRATVALKWEYLAVPWTITVPNAIDLYLASLRHELTSGRGFDWRSREEAARFCLDQKTNLKEALQWAQSAVDMPFVGEENFTTLHTLADLEGANGMTADSEKTLQKALDHPTASALELHQYGRSLLARGEKEKALKVFELNAKKHPNAWPVNVGLMRGYSAVGRLKDAVKAGKLAVQQAPDEVNRKNLEKLVSDLEAGKPIN